MADTRVLAVTALEESGGGTGLVGRLLWQVIRREWPGASRLIAMGGDGSRPPSLAGKGAFGAKLATAHLGTDARWVLFGHLGLVRAQRLLPPRLLAPYGVFLHGVEAWRPLAAGDRRRVAGARLRIANSQFTATRAAGVNPDMGPIEVCPLTLPPEAAPTPRPAGPTSQTVLIVGRMAAGEGYKGHDQLIEAWPHVVARIPGAELLIVGDGDDTPRLRRRAQQVCGGRGITFAGFVDRQTLDRLYAGAAVFAMPSRGEGFGLVYLEAMAHQLPCIGSVHDAAAEVIEHGATGLLVNLDEPDSLGRALVGLLGDPALRLRMGQAGRERLHRCFSFERFSRGIVTLLESHLEAGPP